MNILALEGFWRDVRFGVRMLKRRPGSTVAAILTLMLGIGANTVLFSVIYAVLLKPLPYRDSHRLVFIAERGLRGVPDMVGASDYLQWRRNTRSFESLVAFYPIDQTLIEEGDAVQVRVVMFSGVLQTLGVSPEIGRDFLRPDAGVLCTRRFQWR